MKRGRGCEASSASSPFSPDGRRASKRFLADIIADDVARRLRVAGSGDGGGESAAAPPPDAGGGGGGGGGDPLFPSPSRAVCFDPFGESPAPPLSDLR